MSVLAQAFTGPSLIRSGQQQNAVALSLLETPIRGRLDRINGNWLVYGIIGINVGVWVAFLAARASYETGDARPLRWLFNNMTCSAENLKQGRVWTLITSAFAHQAMEHIFMNSLGLWMFCPAVATSIGAASFLQVYLAGAIGCDLFSLWWNQHYNYRSLGASGALCAIMSFTACLNPRASVLLYGIVPMPLYGVVIGIFLYDLYGARNSSGGGKTDFAGHLGGTLTGIGVYFLRRRLGMRF
ncbi:hypothetical protein FRC14_004225 [Serendipita sp. 396]|nr:hypothetical protein FRC14_004225 [Serendipita sp. 396]KAG8819902.1 hypothetical protein FRC19_009425 [Serendipita sp. 401]